MNSNDTIVIVEGKSDTRRLREIYPQIVTFETSGLGLDEVKMDKLKKFKGEGYRLICFTDPDGPGEIIRKKINQEIPDVYNAFVSRKNSKSSKGKVGIESATAKEIQKALKDLKIVDAQRDVYDLTFLINNNIYGNQKRREKFCDLLCIANGNNKKVLKQLNNFNIERKRVMNILNILE